MTDRMRVSGAAGVPPVEIYPVDPNCPRVVKARAGVRRESGFVRDLMEEFVSHHATVCPRCLAYNAAKGTVDG